MNRTLYFSLRAILLNLLPFLLLAKVIYWLNQHSSEKDTMHYWAWLMIVLMGSCIIWEIIQIRKNGFYWVNKDNTMPQRTSIVIYASIFIILIAINLLALFHVI
jgi:hypothetical protein